MSLRNKLNRLKPHLSVEAPSEMLPVLSQPTSPTLEIPYLDEWKQKNVSPYYFDGDYCLIREVKYPLNYQHGDYRFREFLDAVDIWNQGVIEHPLSAKGFRPEELFFFDTETTGLGGGVGNSIFLLGYASVSGDELIVRQHILPHPGAEVPLYQSFLENVNYKTLVTYNGKSFDWPQVKTQHTLVREHVPKLPSFGHFDLYHGARRLWKHKLERVKLSMVEKDVLGVERVDDIPGFLAPMIYFDFIESKQPQGMLGILEHNEIDILSLVTLYTHLTYQLCGYDCHQTKSETFEVGRWYAALGQKQTAEKLLTEIAEGDDQTSIKAKLMLAYQYKKDQNWEKARDLFQDASKSKGVKNRLESLVELSKIYEHRLKNLTYAFQYCEQAIALVSHEEKRMNFSGDYTMESLQRRKDRLARKWKNSAEKTD